MKKVVVLSWGLSLACPGRVIEEGSCPYGLHGECGSHRGVWGRLSLEAREREGEYWPCCKLLPAAGPRAPGGSDWLERRVRERKKENCMFLQHTKIRVLQTKWSCDIWGRHSPGPVWWFHQAVDDVVFDPLLFVVVLSVCSEIFTRGNSFLMHHCFLGMLQWDWDRIPWLILQQCVYGISREEMPMRHYYTHLPGDGLVIPATRPIEGRSEDNWLSSFEQC